GMTGGPENWWNPSATITGGAGGDSLCPSGLSARGGDGGTAGWGDNPTFDSERPAKPGKPADQGAVGGTAGPKKTPGGLGGFGDAGGPGTHGSGGAGDGTVDGNGHWSPSSGGHGADGNNGGGGGGG